MEGLHLLDVSDLTGDDGTNDSWPTVTAAAVGNCSNPLEEVDWSQPGLIVSLVILGVVNVLVLFGNCLVVLAVFLDSKLRTVTNLFIVSLAMADLSVGLAVLPFSASLEVLDMWIFGEIWCSIWLAVDVWMCTASILNLCAISLDRYLAVTRPVSYPSIMTPFRAKILLAVVWLLSFLICFPPLVGWNDRKINRHPSQQHCDDWSCELTNDPGYVVYSALGSFFIPMLVMLFFYWRIYRAAVETTKAINQGFRTTKEGGGHGRQCVENKERLTLRIHRGRSEHQKPPAALTSVLLARHGCPPGLGPALAGLGSRDIVSRLSDITSTPVVTGDVENGRLDLPQITVTAAAPTVETDCDLCRDGQQDRFYQQQQQQLQLQQFQQMHQQSSSGLRENVSNASQAYKVLYMETPLCSCGRISANGRPAKMGNNKRSALEIFQTAGNHSRKNNKSKYGGHRCLAPRNGGLANIGSGDDGSDPSGSTNSSTKPLKMNRRSNIKAQVKRFKMETKAAKTLGIIVGGFIVCWMPFFTMYVVRAFCPQCIPSVLFSVLFWLGYCNSAINPCIYALFSRDFRFAFQKIVCQCLCTRRSHAQHLSVIKMMVPQGMIAGLGSAAFNTDDSDPYANDHSDQSN
ncbi:probable G-protein coupled receptor No9 [Daphnia magna]|uniref:G-protein-coupled receptor No9 n=2 Tax=Daphnia magna TaxID=35525 RepID=A0A164VEK5_9CRUS|nr:probable G-protein coupled receptor No9 [Daphnia magna]XP_045033262.1 probable G-protein coupled receptor No9 [Daphnia magna]XP_045033263.1 probable G-protein coupled receptor No9 [Daphnia magna]KAK4025987.1 hypothetical protein OUZ56_015016 [Daphnia magna]KZS12244.1 G-protein-coupled receptor No9 [Daphnia magna]